jgi:hypothetical protein
MAEIASSCAVTPMTVYRNIRTGQPAVLKRGKPRSRGYRSY